VPDPSRDMAHDEAAARKWMRVALHDLCQPLTALECCLYVGTMDIDGEPPAEDDLRETIRAALVECERMMSRVRAMQERLHEDDGAETDQR
jgi:hypothetical protein